MTSTNPKKNNPYFEILTIFSPIILVILLLFISPFVAFFGLSAIIAIGLPINLFVKFVSDKVHINKILEELIIFIIISFILFIPPAYKIDQSFFDSINDSKFSNTLFYLGFMWLGSKIWYLLFMTSFNAYSKKSKFKWLGLTMLVFHLIFFLFSLFAQWKLYADPYIF